MQHWTVWLWVIAPLSAGIAYPYVAAQPEYLDWLKTGLGLYVVFFSVMIHEVAHGVAAAWCGDRTAHDAGRLNIDPLCHISWLGSVIVPLALFLAKATFVFGWAKPVPFNPVNLRQHPRDQVMIAVAGPLSNFILAYLCFNVYWLVMLVWRAVSLDLSAPSPYQTAVVAAGFIGAEILMRGILINLVLGVFNLIPFPPLDGSWLLKALLPKQATVIFGKIQIFGFVLILLALKFNLLDIFFYPVYIIFTLVQILLTDFWG